MHGPCQLIVDFNSKASGIVNDVDMASVEVEGNYYDSSSVTSLK